MSSHPAPIDLAVPGLSHTGHVHAHLSAAALVEHAIQRGEGKLTDRGALVALTGKHTGRSPRDRYLVADRECEGLIDWGDVNKRMAEAAFEGLYGRVLAYLQGRELFVTDGSACADPRYRLPVRVITDRAWHALFARCLFREPAGPGSAAPFDPHHGLTVVCASRFHADPPLDGTRTDVFIILHLARRLVLIGGTDYAGEIKKSVFSYLNYLLPGQNVFPMHCSANIGIDGRTALFFGLSGTGKTTLSADSERRLIGDDEHGWSDQGVFNIEGGCYAKCIHLSEQSEPEIFRALHFGSVLENVVVDPDSRRPDFDNDSLTENTRAAYPLGHIHRAEYSGRGSHPDTLLFLTCDAFGVLPPVAQLSIEQAMYHFLSGYTAKVAGTETGVKHPETTFSSCFAAPFLPLRPARYAELLAERLRQHRSRVWLVNTGWTGGPYGGGGERIKLSHTRALVRAILDGTLGRVGMVADPVFGILVPEGCPDVPQAILRARQTWSDPAAYDDQARKLAERFLHNFARHAEQVSETVRLAGPRL